MVVHVVVLVHFEALGAFLDVFESSAEEAHFVGIGCCEGGHAAARYVHFGL